MPVTAFQKKEKKKETLKKIKLKPLALVLWVTEAELSSQDENELFT